MSNKPSLSKSPSITDWGLLPVAISIFPKNDIDPKELVFRNTDIVFEYLFATTISGYPSLSMSPFAIKTGPDPDG